jgi:hypothetical protein
MNPEEIKQFNEKLKQLLAASPVASKIIAQGSSPDAIVNAYMNNDWSGISDVTGKPFSKQMQEEAVATATRALAPAYKAQESYDTSVVREDLAREQGRFSSFLDTEARDFKANKATQDLNAADQGVLFAGSRAQKLNDLKSIYSDREKAERDLTAGNIASTARDHQYQYGNEGAGKLSQFYQLGGGNAYRSNVAGAGGVAAQNGLSKAYNPGAYNFQGTAVTANKASAQTRAAGLLANRANKLTAGGYSNKL